MNIIWTYYGLGQIWTSVGCLIFKHPSFVQYLSMTNVCPLFVCSGILYMPTPALNFGPCLDKLWIWTKFGACYQWLDRSWTVNPVIVLLLSHYCPTIVLTLSKVCPNLVQLLSSYCPLKLGLSSYCQVGDKFLSS